MIPDARKINSDPIYYAHLIKRIGMPHDWVAKQSGISRRRLLYLAAGERMIDGILKPVLMSYPEQFLLECLAHQATTPS
jgi:hypothetical protein